MVEGLAIAGGSLHSDGCRNAEGGLAGDCGRKVVVDALANIGALHALTVLELEVAIAGPYQVQDDASGNALAQEEMLKAWVTAPLARRQNIEHFVEVVCGGFLHLRDVFFILQAVGFFAIHFDDLGLVFDGQFVAGLVAVDADFGVWIDQVNKLPIRHVKEDSLNQLRGDGGVVCHGGVFQEKRHDNLAHGEDAPWREGGHEGAARAPTIGYEFSAGAEVKVGKF